MIAKKFILSACAILTLATSPLMSQDMKIGVVNFKECVEKSKLGQKEQESFDSLRKQMETVLKEKEKALTEIANKFNDPDYLDSLSAEAEAELKHKFRTLNQELNQHQNQFYQALNQANMKILQKMSENITQASEKLAKDDKLDLVVNKESSFFSNNKLDVSNKIIKIMDEMYVKEEKVQK